MAFVIFPTKSAVKSVGQALHLALNEAGFGQALFATYADRYSKNGAGSLYVYNRAIERNNIDQNSKSNYFVCVLHEGNTIRAFMTNPSESREAGNFDFDRYEVTFTFKGGSGEKFAADVVQSAKALSSLKPENSYRIIIHTHLGQLSGISLNSGGSAMSDDGVSSDKALLLNLIYHNVDFCALTSHNHFLYGAWNSFNYEAKKYGIQLIAGFEATLPIHQFEPWLSGTDEGKVHNPNGPHVVLLFRCPETAQEFWKWFFKKRGTYKYAPNASEFVELAKIYDIIEQHYSDSVARLIAHPACDVDLPDVGIINRAAKGEISWAEVEGFLARSQAIGIFNTVLDEGELDFDAYRRQVKQCAFFSEAEKERRLKNMEQTEVKIRAMVFKHLGSPKLTPNNINMALAKEYCGRFSILPYVDTDAHNFNWLYSKIGPFFIRIKDMGLIGRGHNRLWLPSLPRTKPTAEDIVRFMITPIHLPNAEWKAQLFSEMRDGKVQITQARQDISWFQKALDGIEKAYYYLKQGKVLLEDTINSSKSQSQIHINSGRGSIP
ncbi:MAG: hypothetical protein N3E51_01025 [Candidatus Micrarchaeota archaeon]|nr:hypothetical protein [Candidatus Micrarchaeota archaeon]